MKWSSNAMQPTGLADLGQFSYQTIPCQFSAQQLPESDLFAIEWGRRAGKFHNAVQDLWQTWWATYEVKEDIKQYTDKASTKYHDVTGRKLGEDSVKVGAFASIVYVLIMFGGCIPVTILTALAASWVVGAEKIQQEAKDDVKKRKMNPDYPYWKRQRARYLKRFVEGYFEQIRGDPINPDLSFQVQDRTTPSTVGIEEILLADEPPQLAPMSNEMNAQPNFGRKVFGIPQQPMWAPDSSLKFGDEVQSVPSVLSRGAQSPFEMPLQGRKLDDLAPPKPADALYGRTVIGAWKVSLAFV